MFKLLRLGIVFSFMCLLMTNQANAGFMVEPYLGYVVSGSDKGTPKTEFSGLEYGAKAGYSLVGVSFGADYNMSATTAEQTGATDTDFKGTNLGAFVGFEFPVLVKVWGSYYINSELKIDSGTTSGSKYKGSGMGAGIGFKILPFVSLNLDYKKFTYDELAGVKLTTDVEVDWVVVGVSIPLP